MQATYSRIPLKSQNRDGLVTKVIHVRYPEDKLSVFSYPHQWNAIMAMQSIAIVYLKMRAQHRYILHACSIMYSKWLD